MERITDFDDIQDYALNIPNYLSFAFPKNVKISVKLDNDEYMGVCKSVAEIMMHQPSSKAMLNFKLDSINVGGVIVSVGLNEHISTPMSPAPTSLPQVSGISDAIMFVDSVKKVFNIPENVEFLVTCGRDLALTPYKIENLKWVERVKDS
tara:strand:+ start:2526 stop:2975 length:450 start_codon:yes stop_codon:yes gene_type:complete